MPPRLQGLSVSGGDPVGGVAVHERLCTLNLRATPRGQLQHCLAALVNLEVRDLVGVVPVETISDSHPRSTNREVQCSRTCRTECRRK